MNAPADLNKRKIISDVALGRIPHFRINHKGYVRLKYRKVLPVSI